MLLGFAREKTKLCCGSFLCNVYGVALRFMQKVRPGFWEVENIKRGCCVDDFLNVRGGQMFNNKLLSIMQI